MCFVCEFNLESEGCGFWLMVLVPFPHSSLVWFLVPPWPFIPTPPPRPRTSPLPCMGLSPSPFRREGKRRRGEGTCPLLRRMGAIYPHGLQPFPWALSSTHSLKSNLNRTISLIWGEGPCRESLQGVGLALAELASCDCVVGSCERCILWASRSSVSCANPSTWEAWC